jgi:hypothetical protein
MAIRYARAHAHFEGRCAVEEALALVDFLRKHPRAKISLAKCTSMHGALLQVILALRPAVTSLPPDPLLAGLIRHHDTTEDLVTV